MPSPWSLPAWSIQSLVGFCVAVLLATVNATASDVLVPNRQVTVGVSASWTTAPSSAICETFAYFAAVEESSHGSDSAGSKHAPASAVAYPILSRILRRMHSSRQPENTAIFSDWAGATQLALQGAREFYHPEPNIHETLLPLELSLRAHAPFCEMHQALAQQALSFVDATLSPRDAYEHAFVVLAQTNPILVHSTQDLHVQLQNVPIVPATGNTTMNMVWAQTLANELYYTQYSNKNLDMPMAILYGQPDSISFFSFFQYLEQASIPFVVRFMTPPLDDNDDNKDDNDRARTQTRTYLQGYGVRVDIRNIEYTAFDDKGHVHPQTNETSQQDSSSKDLQTLEDTQILQELTPILHLQQFLLRHSKSNLTLSTKDSDLLTEYHSYMNQAQTIPPKTQWKDLALQATTAVATGHQYKLQDPLWTLQQLAQNLPSHASALVQLTVPDHIRQAAERVNQMLGASSFSTMHHMLMARGHPGGIFELYVNGKKVSLQAPTFNIFQILQIIREEDYLLSQMKLSLKPYFSNHLNTNCLHHVFQILYNWVAMGRDEFEKQAKIKKNTETNLENQDEMDPLGNEQSYSPFRIDVGHGYRGAVMYINDVEKDDRYKSWPRQVTQMLMAMQFQSPPRIRRNMLTVLLVLDPTTTDLDQVNHLTMTIHILLNLVQSGFPLRIGLLLVQDEHVLHCKQQLHPYDHLERTCSVPQPWTTLSPTASNMESFSSMHTAFLMVQHVLKAYDGFFALQYVGKMLEELNDAEMESSSITLKHLIDFHISIMSMIDVPSDKARAEILFVLESHSDNESEETYAKAVTFAARKNVKSGSAFVNGRPVLLSEPRDLQTVVMEELTYIAELIQIGKITDSKPRSVYGHLLNSERVYPKVHPLLVEQNRGVYVNIDHNYDHLSILTTLKDPSVPIIDLDTIFLLEIVVDVSSEYGLDFGLSGLNAVQALSEKFETDTKYQHVGVAVRFHAADSAVVNDSVRRVLCSASQLDIREFQTFLILVKDAWKNGKDIQSYKDALDIISKVQNDDSCSTISKAPRLSENSNYISLNGRYYAPPSGDLLHLDDIEILLDLEKTTSRAITQELQEHITGDYAFDIIGRIAAYLGKHFASDKAQRKDVDGVLKRLRSEPSIEPLLMSWNQEVDKVRVVCLLDPLTEAAQRATSLLTIIRDVLRLPLIVVIAPRVEIHEDSPLPISSYYRFVAHPESYLSLNPPAASFKFLPTNHVLTLRMDVPESWDIQQIKSIQDTDNLRCDLQVCGDTAYGNTQDSLSENDAPSQPHDMTYVEYGLKSLLFFGQCLDVSVGSPPNGLQLTLSKISGLKDSSYLHSKENNFLEHARILPDGSISTTRARTNNSSYLDSVEHHSDTLVMKTLGYWQLRANPGVWRLEIASNSRGASIFEIIDGTFDRSGVLVEKSLEADNSPSSHQILIKKDYLSKYEPLLVRRKEGFEEAELLSSVDNMTEYKSDDDTVHVFSLATGHLYERFLKIMMLSVTKRTSTRVKFWLFENFLSPGFKSSVAYMADRIGCQVEFVTYKWPEWLRGQSEKQRIIWGYKILFLDVLFPLNLKKIIYVDADQVVRADLKELWDLDLEGAPYGYTPFCTSRESTLGYQFWRSGFWKDHLRGKPYHISALYVVDLDTFRRQLVGDHLRSVYQQLSADPNSLSNLDQDLPNYVQDVIKIHSLPQEWLWCESWCSDETKATAKTIDLCNNPEHKEPKVSMAKRIISGELFPESWIELDNEVHDLEREFLVMSQG